MDVMSNARSALTVFQRALSTTSNNIANVYTEGYSRQSVEFQSRSSGIEGNLQAGGGIEIGSIGRAYDENVTSSLRDANSLYDEVDTLYQLSSQIDNLFADSETGIGTQAQNFYNAAEGVANDPLSIPARQVMLSEAESLAGRYREVNNQLNSISEYSSEMLYDEIASVNTLTSQIAALNAQIVDQSGQGTAPANELLDKRDQLITDLSSKISVTAVTQYDNSASVFMGSGQSLVLGKTAQTVSLEEEPGSMNMTVHISSGRADEEPIDITSRLNGGTIGGILQFQQEVLQPAENRLGLHTLAFAHTFNTQHQQGYNLNGEKMDIDLNTGEMIDFFNLDGLPQLQDQENIYLFDSDTQDFTNGVTAYFARDDITELKPRSYSITRVQYKDNSTALGSSGSIDLGFVIKDKQTGKTLIDTRDGTVESGAEIRSNEEVFLDGLTINVANMAQGATVTLSPYKDLASSIHLNSDITVTDIAAAGGIAADGTVLSGDNRNGKALADIGTSNVFDFSGNGKTDTSLTDLYSELVTTVGTKTHIADVSRQANELILQQAQDKRDEVSGVNLDEEAADLLKFQQAYQAAAKVMSTSDQLFQSLLQSIR